MRHGAMLRTCTVAIAALCAAGVAGAQSRGELHLRRLIALPQGAIPPTAILMPANRDYNYRVGRVAVGRQHNTIAGDFTAVAAGMDVQWRGGSTFGVHGGYQFADCAPGAPDCGENAMFGARARLNVITGGPTVAALIGDNSATTTVGLEAGIGYASHAIGGRNACGVDVGLPLSLAMFQRVRVLSFITPGIAWDARCPRGGSPGGAASTMLGAGLGILQLWHPGLDVTIGAQRIFRQGSGTQVGLSVTYVWLP